jgi:hypothetical protein
MKTFGRVNRGPLMFLAPSFFVQAARLIRPSAC